VSNNVLKLAVVLIVGREQFRVKAALALLLFVASSVAVLWMW
jgi:hypothetical protein